MVAFEGALHTGPMTERLYGEYLTPFAAFSHPFSKENPNMNPEGIKMLSIPGKIEAIQKYLSEKYHEMNGCAENVVEQIEKFLTEKEYKAIDAVMVKLPVIFLKDGDQATEDHPSEKNPQEYVGPATKSSKDD